MLIRKIYPDCSSSLALDAAHVKYDVWTLPWGIIVFVFSFICCSTILLTLSDTFQKTSSLCTDYRHCRFNIFYFLFDFLKFINHIRDYLWHLLSCHYGLTRTLYAFHRQPFSHAVARAISVPWHLRDRLLHNMPVFCLSRIRSIYFQPCSLKRSVNTHDIFDLSFAIYTSYASFSIWKKFILTTVECSLDLKFRVNCWSSKCASISEAGEGTFCTLLDNEWL